MGPPWHTCATSPCRRWPPTWLRTTEGKRQQLQAAPRHMKGGSMDSSGASLITILGIEHRSYYHDGWKISRLSSPGAQGSVVGDNVRGLWS